MISGSRCLLGKFNNRMEKNATNIDINIGNHDSSFNWDGCIAVWMFDGNNVNTLLATKSAIRQWILMPTIAHVYTLFLITKSMVVASLHEQVLHVIDYVARNDYKILIRK